jgi:hypothetical protein
LKRVVFLSFILIFSAIPHLARPYSSVTVPIDDPVYRQLDKLAAYGLIKTMIEGQKPYVRAEIGRLIAEALKNYPKFESWYRDDPELGTQEAAKRLSAKIYVDRLLRQLKFQYREELIQRGVLTGEVPRFQGRVVDYLRGDFIYLDEDKSVIPADNGLGGINAILQPLVQYRGGRHYQKGSNWSFETHHWARLGKYFSIQVEPRFQAQVARAPLEDENKLFVQRLNGRFTFEKLDLQIGRDSVDWGPTSRGGLVFSSNPRPLDFIKLSSISPFYMPFFFKHLGLFEMSFLAANLGPEQVFENPWLFVSKISTRRDEYLEFGMTGVLEMGGEGAPSVSFGQGFLDFFDFDNHDSRTNKVVAFELIGRIPPLRGMELYLELQFEDFTTNLNTMFVYDTSYLGGIYLPRLNSTGTLDFRLEYRRLSPRYSRSTLFTDGLTENQLLLGDPLGPDSFAVYSQFHYELNPTNLLSFSFQFSQRNNNLYEKNGTGINQLADLGEESRYLYRVGLRRIFNRYLVGRFNLGLEQVRNLNFNANDDTLYWMGEAGFTIYFHPHIDKQSTY